MRVYIAGPMTGHAELNFPAFHAAAATLRAESHHVENPAEINADPAAKWVDCMRMDIARLVTCDAVYLLPGWERSRGARIEHQLAAGLGLNVLLAPEAQAPAALPQAAYDVLAELMRAAAKFPTWPTDPLHALAVLGEEFGELTKDMLQLTYEPHKTSAENVRTEAIQTAAMALRLCMSLDRYEYRPGVQHLQDGRQQPVAILSQECAA